jgi:Stage II sporulation protein E (SpoIIE)
VIVGTRAALRRTLHRNHGTARGQVLHWSTGSRRSQQLSLVLLMAGLTVSFAISLVEYTWMPLTAYFVWLLLGMVLLRFRPLAALCVTAVAFGVVAVALDGPSRPLSVSVVLGMVAGVVVILAQSSRQRSGLPAALGEAVLAELRDRLQAQATVPPLPEGWWSQSAMLAAHEARYAGDFLVADLRIRGDGGRDLEMVLVDVCGKGVDAGPDALQFAGALGGLIGALPPEPLMRAANTFLLRQPSDEAMATAVHVLVDLETGNYRIHSAGHPPALRWDGTTWSVDTARGTALGIVPDPDLEATTGRLGPGEALMFYTDGVVESRSASLDDGIAWLRTVGAAAMREGLPGTAGRIISQVPRGDDDRAVLILARTLPESGAAAPSGAPPGATATRRRPMARQSSET